MPELLEVFGAAVPEFPVGMVVTLPPVGPPEEEDPPGVFPAVPPGDEVGVEEPPGEEPVFPAGEAAELFVSGAALETPLMLFVSFKHTPFWSKV